MNAFQIMGYYIKKPENFKTENSKLYAMIGVAAQKNFMSSFEVEPLVEFDVIVWKGMSREFLEAIPLNSTIGVRGRLEIIDNRLMLVAEHVEKLEPML